MINDIPRSLKLGIAAGIGLFIGFISLRNATIVVDDPATLVTSGTLLRAGPIMASLGFALIVALAARGLSAAVLLGMLAMTVLGWLTGTAEFKGVLALPRTRRPCSSPSIFRGPFPCPC